MAEPGEFTKRAFLNGRIDLIEAEAVGDLINAETEKSRKLAINSLTGNLSKKIDDLRDIILDIEANIEVNIDYPEYEEGEDYTKDKFLHLVKNLKNKIKELICASENGRIVKQGINVALIGKPNAGKSSILNYMLEEEKAIVTNIPGTTRDIVEGKIKLSGIILNLIDTAGIRETIDEVEKIGVEKSIKASENADLVIYVIDNSLPLNEEDLDVLNNLKDKKVIILINKNDLESKINLDLIKNYNIVYGNTLELNGLDNLKNEIINMFNLKEIDNQDYTYLSNVRTISLIKNVDKIIDNIIDNINNMPIDMFTIDLRNCYDILGEIIGKTYQDDLLDKLFSKFCLGK